MLAILLSLDLKSNQFPLCDKAGWDANGVRQQLMWTINFSPSAVACTWGRTAVCLYWLGTARGRILRRSTSPLEKHKPESKPENKGNIFLFTKFIFLYPWYIIILPREIQRQDGGCRRWGRAQSSAVGLQEMPTAPWHCLKPCLQIWQRKGILKSRGLRSWAGNSSVSWEGWTFSSPNPWVGH